MKRKSVIYVMMFIVLFAVGGLLMYRNSVVKKEAARTTEFGSNECKSGPIPGRISIGKDGQTSESVILNILEKNGGKITEDFSEFSLKYADIPIGSEDKVIKELTALPGVRADYENRGCTS